MLNFKVALSDFALIYTISKRASALLKERDSTKVHIELEMDLEAVHNCCPLRLADLLGTSDFDLIHEIVGICENFYRKTGYFQNSFWPRFAVHEPEAIAPRPAIIRRKRYSEQTFMAPVGSSTGSIIRPTA
jgi:hypothetical protein